MQWAVRHAVRFCWMECGLPTRLVFVWENLGPTHFDRLRAVEADGAFSVTAIELFGTSTVYDWDSTGYRGLRRITLYPDGSRPHRALWWRLLQAIWRQRADAVFLCHYEKPAAFLAALALRLCGRRVFTMIDSKFDDKPRAIWRELAKVLAMAPYRGALVGSHRSAEYVRFLGMGNRLVAEGFDCLDIARLQAASAGEAFLPHAERDFLIVARLVAKKNIDFAIRAYAQYRMMAAHPRRLRIIGYGAGEGELRRLVAALGLDDAVLFESARDSAEVARAMHRGLALILPSIEEQFGFVVIEALAQGLPVLVSGNAGAADGLVDNAVNGWIIDLHRPAALIAAMTLLDRDEQAWAAARKAALASAWRGDVRHFVDGIAALAGWG